MRLPSQIDEARGSRCTLSQQNQSMPLTNPLHYLQQLFPIRFQKLARWSHNLAMGLGAGIDLRQAVRTSSGELLTSFSEFHLVVDEIDRGSPLSEALLPVAHRLPSFFLPVIRCGEQTGRLEETLLFLARHCEQLDRPQQALRELWLAPLAVYFGGQCLVFVAQFFLGTWRGLGFATEQLIVSIGSAAALVLLWRFTPLPLLLDQVRLWIPGLADCERELAISRFLHVLSLFENAGGQRVEQMWRRACEAVSNEWLRRDLLRAGHPWQPGRTLTDTLRSASPFRPLECDELQIGEESGLLAEVAERVAKRTEETAIARLHMIAAIVHRITFGLILFSVVQVVVSLLMLFGRR